MDDCPQLSVEVSRPNPKNVSCLDASNKAPCNPVGIEELGLRLESTNLKMYIEYIYIYIYNRCQATNHNGRHDANQT